METTAEKLAATIQQAQGRITTAEALQLLIAIVTIRANIKPIF